MKKIFLMAAVAMLFAAAAAQAQTQTAPRTRPLPPFGGLPGAGWMSVNKRGLCIDGEPVSAKQAKSYARPYREAMKQLRRGQGWETGALFLAGAGGAAIGMDIGEAMIYPRRESTAPLPAMSLRPPMTVRFSGVAADAAAGVGNGVTAAVVAAAGRNRAAAAPAGTPDAAKRAVIPPPPDLRERCARVRKIPLWGRCGRASRRGRWISCLGNIVRYCPQR